MSTLNPAASDLYRSLRRLETDGDVYAFLSDLCTPAELKMLCDRWMVAKLLHMGFTYRTIYQKTGASSVTVARMAKTFAQGSGMLGEACQRRQEALEKELSQLPG